MIRVNIGGVPEHFNYPWHYGIEHGLFKNVDIDLNWINYPGGTGAMCSALRNNDLDIAIVLTEGIIKDISVGNPSKIIQTYVDTPLLWGIHVNNFSNFDDVKDLKGKTAAISRMGSGSHLMSFINATKYNWDLDKDLNFKIVNDINGGIKALQEGSADYFLWEKYTTKPLVDNKIFKSLGDCPTPWPCFMIVASNKFISENKNNLEKILLTINSVTKQIKDIPSIENRISKKYCIQLNDIEKWLRITNWSQQLPSKRIITKTQTKLFENKIIKHELNYEDLVFKVY